VKIQGEHYFQAPREKVWETVLDPKALSSSMPGFQRLDTIGENEYEGALEVKVGPVQGDFQGTLKLSDLKAPASYRFSLNGMGAAGFVDGDGVLVLEESGGGTRLHYDLDAKVGGRIAGVGQRLLDSSAKVMARQTLEGLERHFPSQTQVKVVTKQEAAPVEAPAMATKRATAARPHKAAAIRAQPTATPATVAAPKPPSQAKFAFDFAKGLVGELVPSAKRPWVISGALITYTIVVILLTRACSG
jgi:carbon monoxide dehydrogenase subunit G